MSFLTTLRDAALFSDLSPLETVLDGLLPDTAGKETLVISDAPDFLEVLKGAQRKSYAETGLEDASLDAEKVISSLNTAPVEFVIIDMRWSTVFLDPEGTFETWSTILEHLKDAAGLRAISVYDRRDLIERQMQVVLRSHQQFLAPSGVVENPFWLPSQLRFGAGIDDQMSFLLGRTVPDYANPQLSDPETRGAARGANPLWIGRSQAFEVIGRSEAAWHIRCLGPLRLYQQGELVNWNIPGGAARKTRALFCYLLQSGEKGAQADRISELIWPDTAGESQKRARLHHAVAMLRKTLGGKDTVSRSGDYYALAAPPGSWTDITAFEQGIRRGLALARDGQLEAALRLYRPAERLYIGDLFEDLPVEYTHNDLDDWCRPQRRWLREMIVKLLREMSFGLRSLGQTEEALEKCQRALSIEPGDEASNVEMLHILHSQSRFDAIERQYKQYLSATGQSAVGAQASPIHRLYEHLLRTA